MRSCVSSAYAISSALSRAFLIAASCGAVSAAAAQPSPLPTVEIVLDRASSAEGAPAPAGNEWKVGDLAGYHFSDPAYAAAGKLEIPADLAKTAGVYLDAAGRFAVLKAGDLQVPALSIRDADGKEIARTAPLALKGGSNLNPQNESDQKPADPIGPLAVDIPGWVRWAAIALGAVLAAILGFFAFRWIRKLRSRVLAKVLPPKTADEEALERLEELLRKKYLEQAQFKKFYFGVSETMKAYFGRRYEFDAEERTTSELLSALEGLVGQPGLDVRMVERVKILFERLDLVKFTDTVPTDDESRTLHEEAQRIVVATKRIHIVAPAAGAGAPGKSSEARA